MSALAQPRAQRASVSFLPVCRSIQLPRHCSTWRCPCSRASATNTWTPYRPGRSPRHCSWTHHRRAEPPSSQSTPSGAAQEPDNESDADSRPESAEPQAETATTGSVVSVSQEVPGQDEGKGPTQRVLQLAATYSKTEPHYLQAKDRSKWWKRGSFPKIPHDSPTDEKIKDQPIQLYKKVVPLAVIFFFSSFNLTILQALKDAIMVTTAGAETLPFLASFVVLPASIAFFGFYARLVNSLPRTQVYYLAIAPFVAFYAFFASCVYPIADTLHPHGLFESVAPLLPAGLHGLVRVVENWTFSLFFCFAELWGSVVIAVLFWTLANDVCSVSEAKTVYPLMGISANVALVVAGNFMKYVSANVVTGASTQQFLQIMVTTIVACAAIMGLTKAWIDVNILSKKDPADTAPPKKKKAKSSFKESLSVLRSSPKIMNLAMLVICYAVSHRLFEFAWKGQLRTLFPTAQAYSGALADVSIYTGYMTIALMLTGKFVFEYLGWGIAALATPTVMMLSGVAFFGLSLACYFGIDFGFGTGLLMAGVIAGACTQVFARSSKFSLFDPAKEMVYIEMTKEEKSKGKAAVDLMGSQVGKSGASWIIQGTLIVLGSATACLPVLSAVYLLVIGVWMNAVVSLRGLMAETEAQRLEQKGDAAAGTGGDAAGNGARDGSGGDGAQPQGAAA